MEDKSKNWVIILIIFAITLLAVGGIYYLLKGKSKFVSPIPAEPSFKVIYSTPTAGPITPSSTPSATPKIKPTKVPVPTAAASPTTTPKTAVTPNP